MGDTRGRDTAALSLSEKRKALCAAQLEALGPEGFGEWLRGQNAAAWPLTDQTIPLGLVLAKHGREARDLVRDAACL